MVGLADNVTPILTSILSYFIFKERFRVIDIVLLGVTLVGAVLISLGYWKEVEPEDVSEKL